MIIWQEVGIIRSMLNSRETAPGEIGWKVPFIQVESAVDAGGVEVDWGSHEDWLVVWDWDGSADQLGKALPELMLGLSAKRRVLAATGSAPNSFSDKVLSVVGKKYRGEWLGEFFPEGVVVNDGTSWIKPEARVNGLKPEHVVRMRSVGKSSVEILGGLIAGGLLRNLEPKPDWVGFYPDSEMLKGASEPLAYTVMGNEEAVRSLRSRYKELVVVESEVEFVQRMLTLGVEKISVISDEFGVPGAWLEQLQRWILHGVQWSLGDRGRLSGLPRGVNKMSGVRQWQGMVGLSGTDIGIVGFGNDRNDLKLLVEADLAVVVNSSGEATQGLLDDLRKEKCSGGVVMVEPGQLGRLVEALS